MRHSLRALFCALIISALAASAAGAATIKGQIVGSPYLADAAHTAVPVLLSKQSAHKAHLSSALAVAVVARKRALTSVKGTVLPGLLRTGDKFTAVATISPSTRKAFYPSLTLRKMRVTKRSTQLSTAELAALVVRLQSNLVSLTTTVNNLASTTAAGLKSLNVQVTSLRADLNTVTMNLAALQASVGALSGQLAAASADLRSRIDQVRADLQPQVDALVTQVDGLVGQLGSCAAPASVLGQICALQNAIALLSPVNLTSLTDRVTNISSVVTDLLSRLSGLTVSSLPADLTGALGTALSTLGGVQSTVTGLGTQLTGLTGTVSGLSTTVGGLTGLVSGVNVGALSGTLTNLLGALGADPSGLNPTSISNLQSSAASAQTQINGILSNLGSVNVTNLNSTVTSLTSTVSGVTSTLNSVCSTLSGANAPVVNLLNILLGTTHLPVIPGC